MEKQPVSFTKIFKWESLVKWNGEQPKEDMQALFHQALTPNLKLLKKLKSKHGENALYDQNKAISVGLNSGLSKEDLQ